jgi:hypothetical protein
MAITHEDADAVMGAREHKLRAAGAKALGATAAESVTKKDRVVAERVGGIDALLQVRAHVDAKRVQTHGDDLEVDGVPRAGEDVFELASEDLTSDGFKAHEKAASSC